MARLPRRARGATLVTFPDLVVVRRGARVSLVNPAHDTHLEVSPNALEILRFFREPATVASFAKKFEVEPSVLEQLQRHAILVDASKVDLLRGGLLAETSKPIGAKARLHDLSAEENCDATFAVFGAPFELGVTCDGGARAGPTEIRRAFPLAADERGRFGVAVLDVDAREQIVTRSLRVLDVGDLQALPQEGLDAVGARVRHVVGSILDATKVPVMLGGDHALTHFALEAVLAKHRALGVIHFDAHLDLNGTVAWLNHANVFWHALRRPEVKAVRQIGVRSLEQLDEWQRAVPEKKVSWVTAREVSRMQSPTALLRGLPRSLPYYLSFDVDVLDPQVAPETGAPVPGGLALADALSLVDAATRSLRIVGADFVEVATGATRRNAAAHATARVLTQFLLARCKRSLLRPSSLATG